jgi:hypothetical protein
MITIKKRICLEDFLNKDYPIVRPGISKKLLDQNGCPIPEIPINAEDYINENEKYNKIDKSFINLLVHFEQTFDNIGIFTNEEFIPSDEIINSEPDYFTRISGLNIENYYTFDEYLVTGFTESQVEVVASYNENNPFIVNLNVSDTPSSEFTGVLEFKDSSVVYVIGGALNLGQYVPNTGVIYETSLTPRIVQNPLTGEYRAIDLTTFKYYTKGIRDYNTVLQALIHEEKFLNIVFEPTIDNDVVVDRGTVNISERHLKLSEIDSVGQMVKYGQNFFNVVDK